LGNVLVFFTPPVVHGFGLAAPVSGLAGFAYYEFSATFHWILVWLMLKSGSQRLARGANQASGLGPVCRLAPMRRIRPTEQRPIAAAGESNGKS
jgi:hypothetical protein